jgi:hypothetical protein
MLNTIMNGPQFWLCANTEAGNTWFPREIIFYRQLLPRITPAGKVILQSEMYNFKNYFRAQVGKVDELPAGGPVSNVQVETSDHTGERLLLLTFLGKLDRFFGVVWPSHPPKIVFDIGDPLIVATSMYTFTRKLKK